MTQRSLTKEEIQRIFAVLEIVEDALVAASGALRGCPEVAEQVICDLDHAIQALHDLGKRSP